MSFNLKGASLTEDVTLTLSDATYFSLSDVSASSADVMAEAGKDITVTYNPNGAVGNHTATLTLSSKGAKDQTIALSGTGFATYHVSWKVNGEPYSVGDPSTTAKSGQSVATLPTAPDPIGTKVFVGWTDAEIGAAQTTAPEVLFTSASEAPVVNGDVTYYAVYATKSGSAPVETLTQTLAYDTWNHGGTTTDKGTVNPPYRLFHTGGYIESKSFDLSTLSKVVVYGGTFGGDSYNKLNIGDGTNTWKDVTVSGDKQAGENIYTEGTPLSGTGVLKITSQCGSTSGNGTGVRISKVEIYTLQGGYTDYVTSISSTASTVKFNAGENGTCETYSLTETAAFAGVTLPECVGNEGYRFMGWSVSEAPTLADAGKAGETYYPGADCTLYAYYKPEYTVTIETPEHGTLKVKNGENAVNSGDKFLAGDVLTITATPDEGYKFRNLQVQDAEPQTFTASNTKEWTMGEANITISANFDAITYSTITKVVNGVATTEQVENDTEIPFANPEASAIPTGYVFMGWTTAAVGGTQADAPDMVSSSVKASTDATYYAVFAVVTSSNEVWEEITKTPEPGTYAILSDEYFMRASIDSKRFANGDATPQISTATPATLITAPAEDCIWEITKPDDYYRIAYGSQYAGGTSTKNEGALLGDVSDNLAKWSIEYGASGFSIINYGRSIATKDNGNKYLRNNGEYGWACYASSTGKAPRLFKKVGETVLGGYCTTIPDVALSVGKTGYATLYYSNFDLVVPEYTEAYTFKSENGTLMESVTYEEGNIIPAGEAVVVYTFNGVPCTLHFKKGIATDDRDASSQLSGTDEATAITEDATYYFYGLSLNKENDINSVGFYWMEDGGVAFTNGAHKAYLKILKSEFTGTQAVRGFAFKGTATGVESVESCSNAPQAIYDLTGRRVSKAGKGIYIINGKKIIK